MLSNYVCVVVHLRFDLGVVAEERRLVALFSYPSHLYGPPVPLMDHIRSEVR